MALESFPIFWKNYNDMKKANTIGADKYFHAKANCEAAKSKDILNALYLSSAREVVDSLYNNPIRKKLPLKTNLSDCADDLKVDLFGLITGIAHPLSDCRDLAKKYRPNGLDNKY